MLSFCLRISFASRMSAGMVLLSCSLTAERRSTSTMTFFRIPGTRVAELEISSNSSMTLMISMTLLLGRAPTLRGRGECFLQPGCDVGWHEAVYVAA